MSSLTVRWRPRGAKGHFLLRRRSFGGAADGSVEFSLHALTAREEVEDWTDPNKGRDLPPRTASDTEVTFEVPEGTQHLRLFFTVTPRIAGKQAEALAVYQRLRVTGDRCLPDAYAVTAHTLRIDERGARGSEVVQHVPSWPLSGIRRFLGCHPLLTVADRGGTLDIDTEFLDLTELWWQLHFRKSPKSGQDGFNPWYLSPLVNQRPGRLRVLANTRTPPLLWFASVPRAAGGNSDPGTPGARPRPGQRSTPMPTPPPDGTAVGGYVFFRPVASGYPYAQDGPAGITDRKHAVKGMRGLCRYLLSGQTRTRRPDLGDLPDLHELLDHSINRELPLNSYGYLCCGMDAALDRTAPRLMKETRTLRVLFLPHPSGGSYGGVPGPRLTDRVSTALRLLWTRGALGGPGQQLAQRDGTVFPVAPQTAPGGTVTGTLRLAPDIWVGGYSFGGEALWGTLSDPGNRQRVGRVIAMDPNGFVARGANLLRATARERRGAFQLRVVWSPYDMVVPPAAELVSAIRGTGAEITVLPRAEGYYRPPPNPQNPWAEYVFEDAKPWRPQMFPDRQMRDWWHQFAVFGGERLAGDPQREESVGFMEATMGP
ncbi:hypothetical protein HUT18_30315 [Streptomyces sp. NA04227]|uniref:hypothetical protein n=1 Tax=Streptomyces sp. NA04227 TaxID=2742136 RepID=UPI00159014EB|nr:hypothetical protein [Streptomyces sp. NA04227]QKW10076.1 hypothetical protein HUT18_30315 [Streptomyces sp. NA04227]